MAKPVKPTPPLLVQNNDQEDMVAHERNVALLQQQTKKVTPNEHIITELMKKTFCVRRKIILEIPCRVSELLKTYPCLKSENQVSS